MTVTIEQARTHIKQSGLIAIMRGDFPLERFFKIAETLSEAGLTIMEVTLNSQNALEAIGELRRKFAGSALLIGAGTVRSAEQVEEAVAARAQFIVSPNFEPAAVAHSQRHGVLHIPGVFTATEAHTAFAAGCPMVKLFPADALGPAYLKALRAPLNDIEFVPTGGVTPDNLAGYVKAGAVALGIGGALISGADQSMQEIMSRAKAFKIAWEQAQHD